MSGPLSDDDVGLLARQAYWDKGDMESLFAEILRARASETEKASEIERLKAELATAQHEVAQMDAALRVTVPEIEARMSSTCVWCGTAAPDPTSTEAMRAYVAEHVKVCANHPMRALEAELARLTPSGQVAEDRNIVAMELGSHPSQAKTQAAAARLAAKAQGYEVMKVERDAAVAGSSTHLEWMKEERTRAEQAEKERDAAIARAEEAEKQALLAWERHAEKDRAYGDMIAQRESAVADNAALLEALGDVEAELPAIADHKSNPGSTIGALTQLHARLCEVRMQPHSGVALLKEKQEREEVVKALAVSVEHLQQEIRRMATDSGAGFSCDVMDEGSAALSKVFP